MIKFLCKINFIQNKIGQISIIKFFIPFKIIYVYKNIIYSFFKIHNHIRNFSHLLKYSQDLPFILAFEKICQLAKF